MRIRGLVLCLWALAGGLAATDAAARMPAHIWSQRFGGTNDDAGFATTVDGAGNVLVTGYFKGTVNFGGGTLVSAGGEDIFVAKYDAAGNHLWSKRFGSSSSDVGLGIAVDGSDNVLLTGHFNDTVNFGGSNLASAGGADIYLVKLSPLGVHQSSQQFGGISDDIGHRVAADGSDNVLLAGTFHAGVSFGGGALVSAGFQDIFVAKYSATGVHQWSKHFGSTSPDFPYGLEADAAGNVLLTGYFRETVDFGGGNLASAGVEDIFIAKYTPSGVHVWSRRFGSTAIDFAYFLAIDAAGDVVVTGAFENSVNFGGGNLVSEGGEDIFVAKYSSAGTHLWSKRFGSSSDDNGLGVAVDGSGNVLLTGRFRGTANFGGDNLVSAGVEDIVVAKFSPAGTHRWSRRFGSGSRDEGRSIAANASGEAFVTGFFQGTVDLGGGNLLSSGVQDIFVAKYSNPEALIADIVDVGNDQGKRVKIRFARSGHDDSLSPTPVTRYEAYRRQDPLPSAALDGAGSAGPISETSLLPPGWFFVGSVPAHREDEYLMLAPTLADSTFADGPHWSVFFVRAATADPGIYYDSAPDSGYSLDNLAPSVPAGFAHSGGNLTWDESHASDFDHFTVYGSNTNSFASATLIDGTVNSSMDVSASPYAYYFVTATDVAGNESRPATLQQPTDAEGAPKHHALSVSAHPNPFNPATMIRYTLPARGRVKIAMHDARGTRVATLLDAERPAGAHTVPWNGGNDAGAVVTSGVYFARLEFGGERRVYKTILLK